MKNFSFQSITLLAFFFVFFSACQKSSSSPGLVENQQQFTAVSASDAEAEDIYNNIFDDVIGTNSNVGLGTGAGVFGLKAPKQGTYGGPQSPCFTVTIDTTVSSNGFPKTVTIDFGSGCTGTDQHTRVGKIITLFTGPLSQAGSTATTTFQGYFVDGLGVSGTHVIRNNSIGGTLIFNVSVLSGMLTASNGNSIAWSRTKTWTQTAGQGSQNLLTYAFSITGNSSGTVIANDSTYQWTTNISSSDPEIRKLSCAWIVQGQNQVTWNDLGGTIDFGSGTCDDQAIVTTSKGATFSISLP
jgi:hypothetical protein